MKTPGVLPGAFEAGYGEVSRVAGRDHAWR